MWKGKTAAEIRALIAELQRKADAKSAELADDANAELSRRVQAEHSEIVAQIEAGRLALVEAESTENRAAPGAGETVEEIVQKRTREALEAERARIDELRSIGKRFGMAADFIAGHETRGTSPRDFKDAVLDALEKRGSEGPIGATQIDVLNDEGETRRSGMVDALVARFARAAGERGVVIPEHARAFGEMGLVEIAAECVGHRGAIRTSRQVGEVLDRAFSRSFVGHSAADFPGIMLDAMNKRLLARYETAAPAYRRFCALYTAVDFRDQNVIRAGDFPSLQPVGENGEIKAGTFGESREKFAVKPYAVRLNVSRVMIVNDNLAAIDQVIGSAGVRVSDWENGVAFGKLLAASGAGPTLVTDGKAVFHADHGNLAGSGTVIDVSAIGAGRAAMMKQTTLDGVKANFTPVTLLTGPDTSTAAEQLVTSITPAQQSTAIPESVRRLAPVADANISGNGWYLFADPSIAPCFVYGYLDGYSGPRLSSQDEFGVQGMSVKLEHDFGVDAIDYRGGYRNSGT